MVRNRWGRIINIGSVVGIGGNIGQSNYSAAKAGVIGFTRSIAKEVATRNITVNYVAPGYVTTDIVEDLTPELKEKILQRVPMGRFGRADEIADLVGYVASDSASYITGQVIAIDGGMVIS
jgi:3-oxoacyl-[acyl-carrier protein] reductase